MADHGPTEQQRRQAQVVAEHLPTGYTAAFDVDVLAQPAEQAEAVPPSEYDPESSFRLQGGDMHRDLFKLDARAQMHHRRANTFHHARPHLRGDENDEDVGDGLSVPDQMAPGGFRRAFMRQRGLQQHMRRPNNFIAARMPVTRNFVEFLDLYGSFAGEDLADSDDDEAVESQDEDSEVGDRDGGQDRRDEGALGERRPLLKRKTMSHAIRLQPSKSTASVTKTFFTLLKAFIGTGIMFLPKAFSNGGMLFSSLAMVVVSVVTMWAFHLLLTVKRESGCSHMGYGEIGEAVGGRWMRGLILGSVALSQLGFVCAGVVFVAENLQSVMQAVVGRSMGSSSGGDGTYADSFWLSAPALILVQLAILLPLALVRNIAKLGPAALLADVFIGFGLGYIYWYDISHLAKDGIHHTVTLFNPAHCTLTIGAVIFTFEGIGLILPVETSMAQPEKFERLLCFVMLLITIIFTSIGALCYATFGNTTRIEVIDSFPQTSGLVNAVQALYALAVLIGTPVQLFPSVRILEGWLFGHRRSGKRSPRTKWFKNAFRMSLVVACAGVSVAGAGNLEKFVSLIGSVACVPLVYIYPPFLHWRGVSGIEMWEKALDWALMGFGAMCMAYTTVVTVVYSFMS